LIPLPPLTEQHRIVAKVDELIALCDRLEEQLTTTQTESHRLLEAVLHQALTDSLQSALESSEKPAKRLARPDAFFLQALGNPFRYETLSNINPRGFWETNYARTHLVTAASWLVGA